MKEKFCLLAACIILVLAIFIHLIPAAQAQHAVTSAGPGPFMLVAHSNNNALAGVFRIDTETGAVSYCYVTGTNSAIVACSPTVQ